MKLVRLTLLSITGCLIGLAFLAGIAFASLNQMQQAQQEVAHLFTLRERLNEFSAASDVLLVHGAEQGTWAVFSEEGRALQEQLKNLAEDHPETQTAVYQIESILESLEAAGVTGSPSLAQWFDASEDIGGPLALPARVRMLVGQVAGHGISLDTAVDQLLRERQQELASRSNRIGAAFAGAALLFGVVCALTFWLLHRRLVGPIRSLQQTIARLRGGESGARVPIRGNDELAEVLRAFNALAEQREEATAALEHSERMLVESQRIAQVGSWRVHLDDMTLEWSAQTYHIIGVDPETFVPTPERFLAHVHPDDVAHLLEMRDLAFSGAQPHDLVFRIVRPDGEVRHVYERAELEYSAEGQPTWLTGTIQDVTQQQEAKEQVRHLSERLRRTLESITDAVFTLDPQWHFTYINAEAERLLRRSRHDLLGRNVWDEFPEAVGTVIEHEYRRAMTEGTTASVEEYYEPLGIWLDIRAYPSEEGLAVFFRDVSEQRDMLERLAQQERELRTSRDDLERALETSQTLINALPANIALLDPSGQILDVNDQWRHFGRANGNPDPSFGVGSNYLTICERASDRAHEARQALDGLREILHGQRESMHLEYPCHAPDQKRWFRMAANRLTSDPMHDDMSNVVVMHIDITERKLAEEELNRLAYEDALTGLWSRNGFVRRFPEHVTAETWQPDAMVVTLDIRQQRDVNDAHGYAAGDELLRGIARRLQAHAGDGAIVGRIGGDEFAIFVPQRGDRDPQQQRDAIAATFAQPFSLGHVSVEAAAMFGYTYLGPEPRDAEELMREAELALFQSRNSGSTDPWIGYTDELHAEARERIQVTRELRDALANDEFQLHFQPKVELRTGELVGAEALLRWMHPERGLLSPAHFIQTAERSQLIGPIGEWTIDEACRCLADWQSAHLDIVRVAVNVSLIQFTIGDLTEVVHDALDRHGVEPAALTLEITESVFDRDPEALLQQLRVLHEMGVRLSLDDFGTGYSSLAYLQRYPFDEVKIDRSFVQQMVDDPYSRKIVNTVLAISESLEAEVVAEGVESLAMRDSLLEMGCIYGQGFYYSVPLEQEDFRWLLERSSVLPLVSGRKG